MKRKIAWSSQHLEIDTMHGRLIDEDQKKAYYDDEDDVVGEKIENVLSTPFGLWRIDDIMNPYKQFKLWMGHTNFTISLKVVNVIKSIPGVEILTILTRYRFLVGVAELFDFRDVRIAINKALKCDNGELIKSPKNKTNKNHDKTQIKEF